MKKKLVKILIMILMLVIIVQSDVLAYQGIDTNISITDTDDTRSSVAITESIVGTLQVAGTIISIIALIIIGMRYMFSSLDARAQMKGVIGYYIAGCILVFATSNVLGFVYSVVNDVEHPWGEPVIVEATCTTPGLKTYTCTDENCKKVSSVEISALGHDYSGWITKTAAKCTEDEILKRTCSRCRKRGN